MNKLIMAIVTLWFSTVPLSSAALALSVVYCEEDTTECKVQNCQTENTVIEWDNQYGSQKRPYKDCATVARTARQSEAMKTLLFVGGIGVVLSALSYVMYRKQSKK